MRLCPLDFSGLDVPIPATGTGEPAFPLGPELLALRFELPIAAHASYLAAVDAWARASGFRDVSRRDAGAVHLRRYERSGARVVLHVGVDGSAASLVVRTPSLACTPYEATSWESLLEASTDHEVAVVEASTDFGTDATSASRGIEHRLGMEPTRLDGFDPAQQAPTPTAARIVDGTLGDKSRLQLPAGTVAGTVVEVDGARHYTIRSPARLSAASLRKHYRAWAAAQGYDVLVDLYDGEQLELALRRRTRGLLIAWARGADHSTVQVGPARQIFARQHGTRRSIAPGSPR